MTLYDIRPRPLEKTEHMAKTRNQQMVNTQKPRATFRVLSQDGDAGLPQNAITCICLPKTAEYVYYLTEPAVA